MEELENKMLIPFYWPDDLDEPEEDDVDDDYYAEKERQHDALRTDR